MEGGAPPNRTAAAGNVRLVLQPAPGAWPALHLLAIAEQRSGGRTPPARPSRRRCAPGRPTPDGTTEGWLAISEPPTELGLGVEPFALIEPRPGRLALFPSYTWHGTRPFPSGERLTVAFDVVTG